MEENVTDLETFALDCAENEVFKARRRRRRRFNAEEGFQQSKDRLRDVESHDCVIYDCSASNSPGEPIPSGQDIMALLAISPIDGRYSAGSSKLQTFLSEFALIKYRILVEVNWVEELLTNHSIVKLYPTSVSQESMDYLKGIATKFKPGDALQVKRLEWCTNHDVKAVEMFVKDSIDSSGCDDLIAIKELVHFCCTSEDINNLSYAMMLRDALKGVIVPAMTGIVETLRRFALEYADTAMLSRTHGQAATPTTFGKEMSLFVVRLSRHLSLIEQVPFQGKFNGAVGNFNAHVAAFPDVDWNDVANGFVSRLGLTYQPYSSQIECHDFIAELCDIMARFNVTLKDLSVDMWLYISRDILKLRTVESEVGSSTMPHKVNPIDFENCEGNLGIANCLFKHFSSQLPVSRLQRDLTDSTTLRNLGVAFAHSLLAYTSCAKGLSKIQLNTVVLQKELDSNWAVLAEPIQTIMRLSGIENPYDVLKKLTRGQEITKDSIGGFLETLKNDPKSKNIDREIDRLANLEPSEYVGIAGSIARSAAKLQF